LTITARKSTPSRHTSVSSSQMFTV